MDCNGSGEVSAPPSPTSSAPLLEDVLGDLESQQKTATKMDPPQMPKTSSGPSGVHDVEGTECAIRTLYEGPPGCRCCINWVETYPDDLRMEVEERTDTIRKALTARMRKNHEDGKALVLDSIVVRNQSLKETLNEVFDGYVGITAKLEKLVFKAPFWPFFYRWQLFTQILERQKENDPKKAKYSQLLYDFLDREICSTRAEINDLLRHGVMTYPLLWSIFEPGMKIFVKPDGFERYFIVEECQYDQREGRMNVLAKFVDWDGTRFGYEKTIVVVCQYAGTKALTDLEVYPASLVPSKEEMEIKAITRGKKFQELRGHHYKAYSGSVKCRRGEKEIIQRVRRSLCLTAAIYIC